MSTGASSLSNMFASVLAYRTTGSSSEIATVVVAISTALATLGLLRAAATLIATRHAVGPTSVDHVLVLLVGGAVCANLAITRLLTASAAGWTPGYVLLVALGVSIFSQEGLRILQFARNRPVHAFWMDTIWTAVMLVPAGLIVSGTQMAASSLLMWWGGGAAISAITGLVLLRLLAVPVRRRAAAGSALAVSLVASAPAASALVVTTLINTGVPSWFGQEAFLSYRAALTVCTPIALLTGALPPMILAAAAAGRSAEVRHQVSLGLRFAGVISAVAVLIWAVWALLPLGVWELWLGSNANLARELFPSAAVGVLGGALATIPVAFISAFRSVVRGTTLAIAAQWVSYGALAIAASLGFALVTSNWLSAAALWAIAAVVAPALFWMYRRDRRAPC